MYISVTGLRFKKPWVLLHFIWHAVRSRRQAAQSKGLISLATTSRNGIQHTLTAWESKSDMEAFKYSGAHKRAIQVFRHFFTGKTYRYESESLPSWDEALRLLDENGKDY